MPQVEFKHTKNLNLNCQDLFEHIEKVINEIDSTAGACKSRGYQIEDFFHTHVFMKVTMLKKEHRDKAFMQKLLERLTTLVVSQLPKNCYYSIELDFFGDYYLTSKT